MSLAHVSHMMHKNFVGNLLKVFRGDEKLGPALQEEFAKIHAITGNMEAMEAEFAAYKSDVEGHVQQIYKESDPNGFKTCAPYSRINLYDIYVASQEDERVVIMKTVRDEIKQVFLNNICAGALGSLGATAQKFAKDNKHRNLTQQETAVGIMKETVQSGQMNELIAGMFSDPDKIRDLVQNAGHFIGENGVDMSSLMSDDDIGKMSEAVANGGINEITKSVMASNYIDSLGEVCTQSGDGTAVDINTAIDRAITQGNMMGHLDEILKKKASQDKE